MRDQFYIGTAGNSYPGDPPHSWHDVFYPKGGRKRAQPLPFYAKWWKHQDGWQRYDYVYSADNIRRLSERLRQHAKESPGTKLYIFSTTMRVLKRWPMT